VWGYQSDVMWYGESGIERGSDGEHQLEYQAVICADGTGGDVRSGESVGTSRTFKLSQSCSSQGHFAGD